jgi:hypothetical protein
MVVPINRFLSIATVQDIIWIQNSCTDAITLLL